jgi:hypothetical protein
MPDKWILITAGLGDASFEAAAGRVASQSKRLFDWQHQIVLTTENINDYCPTCVSSYQDILNPQTVGFGFMAWKAEIVFRTLNEEFGPCDGVVWVDAGCEAVANTFTRFKLRQHFRMAKRVGAEVFSLNTPEVSYTKRDLFQEFPNVLGSDPSPQIQTTNFYLYGDRGLEIAKRWFEVATKSQSLIDESPSKLGEVQNFITHRHDQSVFSLCCKASKQFHSFKPLTSGSGTRLAQARGFFSPFWASRNRTGTSIVPRWFNFSLFAPRRTELLA